MNAQQNKRRNNLINLVKSSSLTTESRQHVRNWSLHMKNSNYGKRTGNLVSITNDISNLFPSSPSSSFEDSTSNVAAEQKADTKQPSEGSLCKQATFSKSSDKTFMEKRLSGINTNLLSFTTKKTNPSLLMNGNDNGSFTLANNSEAHNSSSASDSTKSKAIKRRLTFSEKKKSKEAKKLGRKMHDTSSKTKVSEDSHPDISDIDNCKNYTVVTLNDDVTHHPLNTNPGNGNVEMHSADDQFVIEKETRKNAVNMSADSLQNKKSCETKKNISASLEAKDDEKSVENDSDDENITPAKKQKNNQVINDEHNENFNSDLSADPQTQNLQRWLRNEMRDKSQKNSIDGTYNTKHSIEPTYQLRSLSRIVVHSLRGSKSKQVLQKNQALTNDASDIAKNSSKLSIFDVDVTNITNTSKDQLNHTKMGPPMSTPQYPKPSTTKKKKHDDISHEHSIKEFSAPEIKSTLKEEITGVNANPKSPTLTTSIIGIVEEDTDSEVSVAKEPYLSNDKGDGYAETSPIFVCEEAAAEAGIQIEKVATRNTRKNSRKTTKKQSCIIEKKSKDKEITEEKPKVSALKKRKIVMNKNKKPLRSLLLNHNTLPPPKLIIPEPSPDAVERGLRRSKRARVRTLQEWKGEKLIYGEDGELLGLQTLVSFQPVRADLKIEDWMLPSGTRGPVYFDNVVSDENSDFPNKSTERKAARKTTTRKPSKMKNSKRKNAEKTSSPLIHTSKKVQEEEIEVEDLQDLNEVDDTGFEVAAPASIKQHSLEASRSSDQKLRKNKIKNKSKAKAAKNSGEKRAAESRVSTNGDFDSVKQTSNQPDAALHLTHNSNNHVENVEDEGLNSTILIKQDGQRIAVDASQLISVPENESSYNQTGEPWMESDSIRFTKGISCNGHSMGTITIAPSEKKGLSKMKADILCFFVSKGTVEITIANASKILRVNSYFYVPPQNSYSIRNISNHCHALLNFTQIKMGKNTA